MTRRIDRTASGKGASAASAPRRSDRVATPPPVTDPAVEELVTAMIGEGDVPLPPPGGLASALVTLACGPCDRTTPHPGSAVLVQWLEDLVAAAETLGRPDGRVVSLSVRVLRTEVERMIRFERTRLGQTGGKP